MSQPLVSYDIRLVNGTTETVEAQEYAFQDGQLSFFMVRPGGMYDLVCGYAAGQWQSVRLSPTQNPYMAATQAIAAGAGA